MDSRIAKRSFLLYLANSSRQNSPAKDPPSEPEDISNSSPEPTSRYLERANMIPRCFSIVTNNRLSALAAALSVESTGDEADGDCAFSLPAFKAEVCMEGRADSPEQASLPASEWRISRFRRRSANWRAAHPSRRRPVIMVLDGLVINLTNRPPPIAPPLAFMTSTVQVQDVCIKIPRAGVHDSDPKHYVEFRSDTSVLAEVCKTGQAQDVLDAFIAGDHGMLPTGNLKITMESIAGNTVKGRKAVDLKHLADGDLVFEIVRRKEMGAASKEKVLIVSIDPTSLFMQNEYDADPYLGNQHAAFKSAFVRDLYDVGSGCSIMGPEYRWLEYVADIPLDTLKRLFYDQPLPGVEDDGTKIGDVLQISEDSMQRPLSILSGCSAVPGHDIALCGAKGDIPVRTWMGVSFSLNSSSCPQAIREVISGSFNPSLETCHGFVAAVSDSPDEGGGVVLTVRIALHRDNLPSFLKMPVLPRDAVFQTNLQVNIRSSWVQSSFKILPLPLHIVAGFISDEMSTRPGQTSSRPLERDVYVAGHLEFAKGEFTTVNKLTERSESNARIEAAGGPQHAPAWSKRHADPNYMHLALLHDWCARGGAIIDVDFQPHHASWKERYLEETSRHQVGRHLPRATLFPVDAFPAEWAMSTISECARLPTQPSFGPFLFVLQKAISRYASSKSRRCKAKPSGSVIIEANIPGSALLQLVHKYVSEAQVKVQFKEGAVEATIQNLDDAAKLIGSRDGKFDFDGAGIVQFYGPLTCRWVLYYPKKSSGESLAGADGDAFVIFSKYVAMDRMGGELTGYMDGGVPEGGSGGGKHSREDGGSDRSLEEPGADGEGPGANAPQALSGLPLPQAQPPQVGGGCDDSCEVDGGGEDGNCQSSPEGKR